MSSLPLPSNPEERRQGPRPVPRIGGPGGAGHHGGWKHFLWRAVEVVVLLIAVLVVGVVIFVHTGAFQHLVRGVVQRKAAAAIGTPVSLGRITVHWSWTNPGAEASHIRVAGAAPFPSPPLLTVRRLSLALHVNSWTQRQFTVSDLTLDHPVAHVYVGPNGATNLPAMKSSGGSNTSIFNLGLRQVQIINGVVNYNNRQIPLTADLRGVHLRSACAAAWKEYAGTLGYRQGTLRMGSNPPLPTSLEASFRANPQELRLDPIQLRSGASVVQARVQLHDYAQPRITASYTATLHGAGFRRALANSSIPLGTIDLSGTLTYQNPNHRPVLEALEVRGNLASPALREQISGRTLEVANLRATYLLAGGNARIPDLSAQMLGGRIDGSLVVRNLGGTPQGEAQVQARSLSLDALDRAAGQAPPVIGSARVEGAVNASAAARWSGAFQHVAADARLDLNGGLHRETASGPSPRVADPLRAHLVARYLAPNQLTFTRSWLRTARTQVRLNGTIGLRGLPGPAAPAHAAPRGQIQVVAQSGDLHEVETFLNLVHPPATASGATPSSLGLAGRAAFRGQVSGRLTAPQVRGQLTAGPFDVKGTSWQRLRAGVALSPGQAQVSQGLLEAARGGGTLRFSARAGLSQWALKGNSPIELNVTARQLNLTPLRQAAGLQTPVSGWLDANLHLAGSENRPAGQGMLTLSRAQVYGQPVQRLQAHVEGTGTALQATLNARMPMGNAQAEIRFAPRTRSYQASLTAPALQLGQIAAVQARNLPVRGQLSLTAQGQGTLANPGLTARLQFANLQVSGHALGNVNLDANVANHLAAINLQGRLAQTPVTGQARIQLTGNEPMTAELNTPPIPLKMMLALYKPSLASQIGGETGIHATAQGPLKTPKLLNARVTLPVLRVKYGQAVQLAAVQPVQITYTRGVLSLQPTTIRGTGTDLTLQGAFPVSGNSRMSLLAKGTINLAIIHALQPDLNTSGQLVFDINSFGQRNQPNVEGQIRIVNASISQAGMATGLNHANGVLTLTPNRLQITRLQGEIGGGTLVASGGVAYRPNVSFDLAAQGHDMRILLPQGIRAGLGGHVTMTGTTSKALLEGQIAITSLAFTPDFELSKLTRSVTGPSTLPSQSGFTSNLQLNLGVHSTTAINLVSRTLSLGGTANLHVVGTAADPVVLGRVNLTRGDIIAMGNRYVLQSGTVAFVNPNETQPVINVAANTTVKQYRIHLQFRGTPEHLHTNYTSDPALPPSDVIHLLAFGTTSEAGSNTPPGALGAESLVASQLSSQVTSRVEKIAGISRLSVDPVLGGGNQHNPGAIITVQQRVTSDLFVTFQTDATSTQNESIEVEYQLSPRFSVQAIRDQNGGFAVEMQRRRRW